MEPGFHEIAKANSGVQFIQIDIDEGRVSMPSELSSVGGVPTFKVYHNGRRLEKFGGPDLNRVRNTVTKLKQLPK